jgi:hypothetical protein
MHLFNFTFYYIHCNVSKKGRKIFKTGEILGMKFSRLTLTLSLILILVQSSHIVESKVNSVTQNESGSMNISTDGLQTTTTFEDSINISIIEGSFAVVATDNIGGVYVAFQSHWAEDNNDVESLHIYFIYSHDYGKTWSNSFRVDDNESTSVYCDSPSIAVDQNNGHVFVAWKDNRTGVAKMYIDKSTDRGISFGSDINVYNETNDFIPPWLPFTTNVKINDDGTIYTTWLAYNSSSYTDSNILFAYSIDGGQTFNTPIIINSLEDDVILAHPCIAIENTSVLYIAYAKRTSTFASVYLAKSLNGGTSFQAPVTVTDTSTQRYCGGPKIVLSSDGEIHITWTDNRAGEGTQYLDIYYASSLDGGLSFESNIRVNDDLEKVPPDAHPHFTRGAHGTPTIATDNNSVVHVVWEDFRNFVSDDAYCRDIYYASLNNDMQFSENIKINYVSPEVASVNCADPNLVIDSQNNFFIVYSDAPSGDNNHPFIYFIAGSSDTGQTSEIGIATNDILLISMPAILLIIIFSHRKNKPKKKLRD